jgi:hypothetical protein
MTKSLETNQQRFQDLENSLRQQHSEIKSHQSEFQKVIQSHQAELRKVNERFNDLDHRTLSTMTFCQESSQNVLELRKETSNSILQMRQEAAAQAQEFRSTFARMTRIINTMAIHIAPPSPSDTGSVEGHSYEGSYDPYTDESASVNSTTSHQSEMSVDSRSTAKQGTSPRKKKGKRKITTGELDSVKQHQNPPSDQDPRARKDLSTPDAGTT